MRTLLGLKSVPLSKETRESWDKAGVVFRRRHREEVWNPKYHRHIKAVLNFGCLDMDFSGVPVPIFNRPDTIRAVSSPFALRKTLDEFLPAQTIIGPHWHKNRGWKGQGKVFHEQEQGDCAIFGGALQAHVEGTEYRVLTCSDTIVQASRKHGAAPNFEFEWVGVNGVRKNGIIPLLKEAIPRIPFWKYSIFGFDIIVGDDGPKIIETNTSPGVNEASARRVIMQVRELIK